MVGQELERVGVGSRFGLDEDGALAGTCWAEAWMLQVTTIDVGLSPRGGQCARSGL